MGVFERFERSLERLVEGTFARVFKDEAQPADIARALQRETDDRRVIVGPGRVIAPNAFVVGLGDHDHARLGPYAAQLGDALAEMVADHGREERYSFGGPVVVRFEHDPSLDTGHFLVRSEPTGPERRVGGKSPERAAAPYGPPGKRSEPSASAVKVHGGQITLPPTEATATTQQNPLPRHRIVITSGGDAPLGSPSAQGEELSVPITAPVTLIGRAANAGVRLEDPGVSRRHAELRLTDDVVRLVDAGSTNGTLVNGAPVVAKELTSGDRIQVGSTVLVYSAD